MLSSQIIRSFGSTAIRNSAAATSGHGNRAKQWRMLSLFVGLPGIALCMLNCYLKHIESPPERPEFIPYEHLRLRTTRFPWGNGQKSFFHNPHMNALPNGYEDSEH